VQKVWNKKDFDCVKNYVAPEYTIYIDSADRWERKILNPGGNHLKKENC